jgi:hypothetical protein
MNRRDLIALLGTTAAVWPVALRAQPQERMKLIGVLMAAVADDPEFQARIATFQQGLALLGGPTAATRGLTPDGPSMPTTFAGTRPNWPRSRQTSSWLLLVRRP